MKWFRRVCLIFAADAAFVLFLFSFFTEAVGADWVEPMTGMEFVWVDGGCFQMGDRFHEGWTREHPVHTVCLNGFYIGKYEVTQAQYEKVTKLSPSENYSFFTDTSQHPVTGVSWFDTQNFIDQLNNRSNAGFRLPTEAEWEFAARGRGLLQRYAGGDTIDDLAWYRSNSVENYKSGKNDGEGDRKYFLTGEYRKKNLVSLTHKVGTKAPNSLGIYDMSGNVWEWCGDWYRQDYYEISPERNPSGPEDGSKRIVRGGSWSSVAWNARCSVRFREYPGFRNGSTGFRIVVPGPRKKQF